MNRYENAIEITDLTVAYHKKPVIWDVDLTVPNGVMMAILGPNGAGKSTLIRSILGLLKPLAGEVKIFGRPVSRRHASIAYVPQRSSVDWDFPADVRDVVTMGTYGNLGWFRRPGKKERELAMKKLELVNMHDYCRRQINELSGGQQQRVFIARSLAQEADVYLMDEPFQGVDAGTEEIIVEILKNLRSEGKTVVVVHHDLQTVQRYFDWVAMLNVRMIAAGDVKTTFTESNLKFAYGGKLSYLTQVPHPQESDVEATDPQEKRKGLERWESD